MKHLKTAKNVFLRIIRPTNSYFTTFNKVGLPPVFNHEFPGKITRRSPAANMVTLSEHMSAGPKFN